MRTPSVILLLALGGCGSKVEPPKKRPPPLVTVVAPTVRDVPITLMFTVDIRPVEQADLMSKVPGYVERIHVDRGDPVKKGQLLAEVRPSELPEQVNQAREQVGQTEASYRLAEENAKRSRELYKREMISKAELDQIEAQLQVAAATRGASRSGLGALSTRLSETRIYAPFAGWVARRYLDVGAFAQPGAQGAILTVMRVDEVRVFVNVLESQASQVKRGQPAEITVDALAGKRFSGTVSRVPPALDPATRTLEVEILIPNKDGMLKPGMYGRAMLTVDLHPKAVVLPVEAVITEERERAVYLVENGKAKRARVEIGFDGGDFLEITKGLTGSEQVILAGVDLVADGAPVTVSSKKTPQPATN
jgi:membrane fusion protein, multidrug efflux system